MSLKHLKPQSNTINPNYPKYLSALSRTVLLDNLSRNSCMSLCYALPEVSLYEALLVKQDINFMEMKKASRRNLHIVKTCMPINESYHISGFDSPTNQRFFDTCLIVSYEKQEEN